MDRLCLCTNWTMDEYKMISEIDINDIKELYDLPHGTYFKIASEDDVSVPPDSLEVAVDVVYKFMGVDGMYSKCIAPNGAMHHFAAWTKVIPWSK